jgi:hypothetical protein
VSAAILSVMTRPDVARRLADMAARVPRILACLTLCCGFAAGSACDPTESQPEPTGECAAALEATARFSVDVGGWPAVGDDLTIVAPCTVAGVGGTVALDCEHGDVLRKVSVKLTATPALELPLRVGDVVDFELRRKTDAEADRGFWAVRDGDGALLLGGARSYASTPASDPGFFAPLDLAVDFKICDERKTDSCMLEQRVVLEVADGSETTRVPHGGVATLPSGHQMLVERAILTMSSGDPKVCPVEGTPETYQYLIAAPAM